jgi:hypothetical protein
LRDLPALWSELRSRSLRACRTTALPRPALYAQLAVTQRVDGEPRSVSGNCRGATAIVVVVEAFRGGGDAACDPGLRTSAAGCARLVCGTVAGLCKVRPLPRGSLRPAPG